MVYFLTQPFFATLFRLILRLVGLRERGIGSVPATGSFIYCPNHISDADPPTLLACIPRRSWFIGKQELFDIPLVGWFFHRFRSFPIKRDSPDRAALRRAEACLRRGEPILIFPEGRCARDGKLQHIQSGAALLSVRTGVPIVPIGIQNTDKLLPYGTFFPRWPGVPISVTFGPPIRPQEFMDRGKSAAVEAVTRKLGEELARLTGQEPLPVEAVERAARKPGETKAQTAKEGLS